MTGFASVRGFARGARRVLHATRRYGALVLLLAVPPATAQLPALQEAVQVAGGEFHSCALTRRGGVLCWGSNRFGQLGAFDSSTAQRETPVEVAGLASGVRAIAAGQSHTCAVLTSGAMKCWGRNNSGQLGDGSTIDRPQPVDVLASGETWTAVAAGEEHTCAIGNGGRARCWGRNDRSQLGDGSTTASPRPVDVSGFTGGVTALAAGQYHSCAVRNGGAFCWGENGNGQLGDNSTSRRGTPVAVVGLDANVRELAAARAHSCAVTNAGAASCWGLNANGQLGDGSTTLRRTPVAVTGFGSGTRTLSASLLHTCAIGANGNVRCWGDNFFGQLGDGTGVQRNVAVDVVGLATGAERIASGYRHNCAVLSGAGEVRCWGNNFDGQLGDDSFSNRLVPRDVVGHDAQIERVGTGFQHSCAFSSARGDRCWGDNASGQLGNGTTLASELPVPVAGLTPGTRAMGGGSAHSCALGAGGGVRCWGNNALGQLGDGTTTSRSAPVDVLGLASGVSALAVGSSHACAVVGNGAAMCWGNNGSGRLGAGSGSGSRSSEPLPVVGLDSGVAAVAAGDAHSCALTTAGAVKCWGANGSGQLGNQTLTAAALPVDVVGLSSGVTAIVAGGDSTCALRNGDLRCWGDNTYGQLGDGSTTNRNGPVGVVGLGSGVRAVELSSFHGCAIDGNGALRCWGRNTEGQLGNNSTEQRTSPVAVSGLDRDVAEFSGGGGQSCARLAAGAVRCWGANNFGQVGDGTTWGKRTPVAVVLNEAPRDVASLTPAADNESVAPVSDASGRYVVFQSRASNLVAGDGNGSSDIFRVDRDGGATLRVSVGNGGQQIAGNSLEPTVSGDGNLVAFVAPDAAVAEVKDESAVAAQRRRKAPGQALFLRNLISGTTQRVGAAQPAGTPTSPQLSASGNRIAWTQPNPPGSNGVAGQENVYVATLTPGSGGVTIGAAQCVTCRVLDAAGNPTGTAADGASRNPTLSADGSAIAWESTAGNTAVASLGKTSACPGVTAVFLRLLSGTQATRRISTPTGGGSCGSTGQAASKPSIDGSGRKVVFESTQPLVGSDANGVADVYVWDDTTRTLRVASVGAGGVGGNGASTAAKLSADGSTIAFVSAASNLDTRFADNNGQRDVHVVPTDAGAPPARLSRSASGGEAAQASDRPSLSADGARVNFDSLAKNLSLSALTGVSNVLQRANPLKSATLKSATWWNAQESGWGLFIFDQGNALAPAWFTYDTDGEPLWLIGAALPQPDGSYRGDLFRFTGVPYNRTAAVASQTTRSVGTLTLRYSGDSALRFDYTVDGTSQSKQLTRFPFGPSRIACRPSATASRAGAANYSDVWWGGEANAGWGLFVTHVGNELYALWYTFDADREPLFLIAATARQADGSFTGQLLRQRNGTPMLQIAGAPASSDADVVGNAVLRFSDGERGTWTTTVAGATDTRAISRYQFGDVAAVCDTAPASDDGGVTR